MYRRRFAKFARLALTALAVVTLVGLQACGPRVLSTSPLPTPGSSSPAASGPFGTEPGPTSTVPPPTAGPTPSAASATPTPAGPFALRSSAFVDGGPIPVANTCDGAGTSPGLSWTGAPPGTVTYALIVDDPDAAGFVHWVVYDMDPKLSGLAPGISTSTAGDAPSQGQNSFGKIGYGGPCPPSGTHHYVFRLLALDLRIELRTGGVATASRILAGAAGHILGEARLVGTYRRH